MIKFCNFCQTSINEAEETSCPTLNYAIDTSCPWLPEDRKMKAAANETPGVNELDEALRLLKEVRSAIIGCCDPAGNNEDGYRIRHGELTGWFDQLELAGLHVLRASLSLPRS